MNEVATVDQGQVPSASSNLLDQIVQAASNPEVDAGKMEQLANLALNLRREEQKERFNRDLAAAMMKMPRISKRNQIIIPANAQKGTRERVQGKFASWDNIDAAIRPILSEHNLALRFKIRGDENGTYCTPILLHTNGWVDEGEELRVPPDLSGSKNAAQAIGSSTSYAKRYAACAALNIVTEDEDRDGTSYPLASDPLNDREERLVQEAHAAHADGNYAAWWKQRNASDRSFLIIRGVHAQLSGAPQLPGPRTLSEDMARDSGQDTGDQAEAESPAEQPAAERDSGPDSGPDKRTPEQMVEAYERRLAECQTEGQLMDIQQEARTIRWLSNLQAKHPSLYERATTSSSKRYAEIVAQEQAREEGKLV